ncbi:MAG: hypothetical protein VKJ02_08225 [Snowella sp.]|nr:hypothetical protein [Snowella sp.]
MLWSSVIYHEKYFYVVFSLYFIWFALTLLTQSTSKVSKSIKQYDFFSLIPSWHFFAPNPSVSDYDILYRTKTKLGQESDFIVAYITPIKTIKNILINPQKRKQKVFFDTTYMLLEISSKKDHKHIVLTIPYLLNLHYVSNIVKNSKVKADASQIQFAIAETKNKGLYFTTRIVFLSSWHEL